MSNAERKSLITRLINESCVNGGETDVTRVALFSDLVLEFRKMFSKELSKTEKEYSSVVSVKVSEKEITDMSMCAYRYNFEGGVICPKKYIPKEMFIEDTDKGVSLEDLQSRVKVDLSSYIYSSEQLGNYTRLDIRWEVASDINDVYSGYDMFTLLEGFIGDAHKSESNTHPDLAVLVDIMNLGADTNDICLESDVDIVFAIRKDLLPDSLAQYLDTDYYIGSIPMSPACYSQLSYVDIGCICTTYLSALASVYFKEY